MYIKYLSIKVAFNNNLLQFHSTDIGRCPSGRRSTTGTRVWCKPSRVRIPSSQPLKTTPKNNHHFLILVSFFSIVEQ